MAQPNSRYSFLRGDCGDLMLASDVAINVCCVDHMDNLVIDRITEIIEILEEQERYIDTYEKAIGDLSIKGQVMRSLENARDLLSVCQGISISDGPRILPPRQEDMTNFLKKWRKKKI